MLLRLRGKSAPHSVSLPGGREDARTIPGETSSAPSPLGGKDRMRGNLQNLPRQEQGDPAAHARPYEHGRRSLQHVRADRRGLAKPRTDGAVLEPPAGLAVAGIVETQGTRAVRPRPCSERACLDAPHFRPEAAEPDEDGLARLRLLEAIGDRHGRTRVRLDHEQLQIFAVHLMLLS